jgi:Zn-dependent peptidase ImmA (M78 family)
MMELSELYEELIEFLASNGVVVWDTDWGPGVAVDLRHGHREKGMIVVCGKRSLKQRTFILCHEVGHLFLPKIKDGTFRLKFRKKVGSEKQANTVASLLLDQVDSDLKHEMARYYNRVNRYWIDTGSRKPYNPKKKGSVPIWL